MKSVKFRMIAIALLSAAMPFTAKAQDKVEASVGADFVADFHAGLDTYTTAVCSTPDVVAYKICTD